MTRYLLLLLAVACVPAFGAEWFASPSGNDNTGDGSLSAPFRTVARALDQSGVGDTVTLRGPSGNNTYDECDVRLRVKLTLRSYAGERAHIQCDMSTPESVVLAIDPAASGSRVSGLELSGSQYYGVKMNTDWYRGGGEDGTGASHIILEDLKVHDTGRDGIKVTPQSNYITIRRSEIWNTGARDDSNADGIDNVNGSNMLVEDNYIHDIATTGLYFKGGSRDVIVQRNRVENTGESGILAGFDTSEEFFDPSVNPRYYESVRGIVRNNFVRNTNYSGIGLYAAEDAIIANNTIVNTARLGHAAIYFGLTYQDWDENAGRPPSVNPLIRNNLVIQDGGDCVGIRWSGDLGGMSALDGSPNTDWNAYYNTAGACNFTDRRPGSPLDGGGDFAQWKSYEGVDGATLLTPISVDENGQLPAGSPAIKAGTALPQVTDDIDGHNRVAPFDIGSYEFGASGGSGGEDVFTSGFD